MAEKRVFHSSQNLSPEEIKRVLFEKISEEKTFFLSPKAKDKFSHLSFKKDRVNVISLFSGCGGLDLGFELAGVVANKGISAFDKFKDKNEWESIREKSLFNIVYSNDIFEEANQTYAKNFPSSIFRDNTDIRLISDFPECDLVLGGFPCPGFSEAGPRLIDDKRNFLYLHFIKCIVQSNPRVFVAENVSGMMTLGNGEVFRQIVQDFSAAGYKVFYKLLNSAEYGVPEIRERVILVGIRNDLNYNFSFPEATHGKNKKSFVSLRDAIGDLEENPGEYFVGSFSKIFMSRNRKKGWNEPSFTIQASGRQAPLHPSGSPMIKTGADNFIFGEGPNRRLSVKEIARIQTFPDWFEFSKGFSNRNENAKLDLIYKQIGNAVPVLLAYSIGLEVAKIFKP